MDRDGLGIELLNSEGQIVAEVFRCDADNTLRINTFGFEVPASVLQQLVTRGFEELGSFEDGTPLNEAKPFPPMIVKSKWN